jgi:hypothetical protein
MLVGANWMRTPHHQQQQQQKQQLQPVGAVIAAQLLQ